MSSDAARAYRGLRPDYRGKHLGALSTAARRLLYEGRLRPATGTVLFVCVENTFRSVLSEALFNAAPPAGWRAESAGVQPASSLNPVVAELLRELRIPLGPKVPRLVTSEMVAGADRVVTFGCLDRCPAGAGGKGEDWPVPGATGKTAAELRGIRDDLRRRVERLAARL